MLIPNTALSRETPGASELEQLLDWSAILTVKTSPEARTLNLDDPGLWVDALDWAGISNVLESPDYEYRSSRNFHIAISFTAGLSPARTDILADASMYRTAQSHVQGENTILPEQHLCRAIIVWDPKDPTTKETVTRFPREQAP